MCEQLPKQVICKKLSENENSTNRWVKMFKNVDKNGATVDYDVVMRESISDTKTVVAHVDAGVASDVFAAISNAYNYGYIEGLKAGLSQAAE